MLESNAPDLTLPVDDFFDVVSNNGKKAAALKAFGALRAHGNVGIERNLDAAASIAALKISLPHGEFSRFCKVELQILNELRRTFAKARQTQGSRQRRPSMGRDTETSVGRMPVSSQLGRACWRLAQKGGDPKAKDRLQNARRPVA
jgi:hypothetical protein